MNVVNCSTRLPPTPANGVQAYPVLVKPAQGNHYSIPQGVAWDGKRWITDDMRDGGLVPFTEGTIVAWVDPLAEVVVGYVPTSGCVTAPVEDPLNLTVTLAGFNPVSKIGVIKLIRELTGLGLGEAKAFVEAGNKAVKDGLSVGDAAALRTKIEAAGGVVSVQAS